MGERKVPNKYIPPDFDPKKILRLCKPNNQQKKIRFMLPVRIRCNTCGSYMSEGTKFNCREEEVINETYLGIIIHRFYIKCTNCSAEVTIKTDSKNSGYTVESGAVGVYNGLEEEEKHDVAENALESLEKRTKVSKREIEVMAALDEMKSMKSRRASRTRIDEEKNYEVFDKEKKKPNRRVNGTYPIQISSVRIVSKKTAKLTRGLESLCHNYGSDSDEEKHATFDILADLIINIENLGDNKGQQVAVKVILKEKMKTAIAIEDVSREVKILRALSGHDDLPYFYDAY
uniref:Splicing factor YJU2 n=1 Tax=Brassica campestris TaxID=3711 RepID=M4DPE7_BRACM